MINLLNLILAIILMSRSYSFMSIYIEIEKIGITQLSHFLQPSVL